MGSKKRDNVMSSTDEIKIVEAPTEVTADATASADDAATAAAPTAEETAAAEKAAAKKAKRAQGRSKKYQSVRAKVDKTKKYDPFAAMELVKKLSYSKFDGTISAHVVVKEAGTTVAFTPPHSTGKTIRVAIVTDDLLKEVEAGNINFDILVSAPEYMPKLARFASVLGPKGLMPNPKNGTLTKDTENQKKRLEAGTVTVKTEKKAPLMHVQIGKVSMDTKALVENLEALLKSVGTKLERVTIAASMSPGIKVSTLSAAE
jgi:large subunit ribosomal protein L1